MEQLALFDLDRFTRSIPLPRKADFQDILERMQKHEKALREEAIHLLEEDQYMLSLRPDQRLTA